MSYFFVVFCGITASLSINMLTVTGYLFSVFTFLFHDCVDQVNPRQMIP